MMAAAQHARAADGLHNVERLAIEHDDFRASSDVQELLVCVGRQCQIARKWRIAFDALLDELAVCRKDLHAPVFSIGHIEPRARC